MSTDIIEASVKSYINAINKYYYENIEIHKLMGNKNTRERSCSHGNDHQSEDSGRPCWKRNGRAGRTIELPPGRGTGNDVTAPVAIAEFKRLELDKVFDQNKIVLVPDHFTPIRILSPPNSVK